MRPPKRVSAFLFLKIYGGTLLFSFRYGRRACPKKAHAKREGPTPSLHHRLHCCAASGADDGLELNAGLGCVSAAAAVAGYEVVEGKRIVVSDGPELREQAELFRFALLHIRT